MIVLVMFDAGDKMLLLHRLPNGSAKTAIQTYLLRRISYFDGAII